MKTIVLAGLLTALLVTTQDYIYGVILFVYLIDKIK